MYRYRESQSRLNRLALVLGGDRLSFRVHYWGASPGHMDNPVHKHSFFEVCHVLDGEGIYMDDGVEYRVGKGVFFVSRPGVTHQIRSRGGMDLLFVAFETDESRTAPEELELFRKLALQKEVLVEDGIDSPSACLWRSLLVPERESRAIPAARVAALAHSLLASFPNLFAADAPAPLQAPARYPALLHQAKMFIRDNLDQPLSLGMVAAYLNVSRRHLSRLFSEGIHESFTGFIRKERVRQAAHLLGSTDLSIKEIAERTGFGSVHYFSRIFAREQKQTPGRYRRELRGP